MGRGSAVLSLCAYGRESPSDASGYELASRYAAACARPSVASASSAGAYMLTALAAVRRATSSGCVPVACAQRGAAGAHGARAQTNRKRSAHCVRCVALHVPQQLRALLCAPHLGVYPEHGIELRIDLGVAARGLFRGRAAVALEQQPVGWHSGDHSRRLLRAHVDAVRETKVQPGIASRTRRQTSSAQRARNVPPQCARAGARARTCRRTSSTCRAAGRCPPPHRTRAGRWSAAMLLPPTISPAGLPAPARSARSPEGEAPRRARAAP